MIKQLLIKNFQSWKSGEFNFHEGVNIIIGETDQGKSAIMRMFNLIINNKTPKGNYITKGKKEYKGIIVINKNKITRQFKNNTHSYILKPKDKKSKKLDAVGKGDTPEFISKILNMSSINMQFQHDDIFMLRLSAGETARFLNEVVDLSDIHETTKNISKVLRDEEKELKESETTRAELKEDLENFEWIEEAEELLEILEKKKQIKEKLTDKRNTLIKCLEIVQDQQKIISEADIYIKLSARIEQIRKLIDKRKIIKKNQGELGILYLSITRNLNKVKEAEKIIKAKKEVERLYKKYNKRSKLNAKLKSLELLYIEIKDNKKWISEAKDYIKIATKEFNKLMGSKCVLCGAKIKEN